MESMERVLSEWGAVEVSAIEVYRDIFQLGDGFIQREGEPAGSHKTNPIIIGSKEGRVVRRIMFEDTFEELLGEFQGYDWAFLNGLTYWGRVNKAASQSRMCALIFDLDGATPKTLEAFLSGALKAHAYPVPNYVVLSGRGLHLYYVFEQPVDLYPNVKTQLKELKYALTDKMWNRYTSTEERVQHQGINQSFRVIGGRTKDGDGIVRAFRLSTTPVWLDHLNEFVPEGSRIDASKLWRDGKLTLDEARDKFPEWYERRVLGRKPPGHWTVKEDLYNWWIRQVREGATFGHRYFCVMCLAIYGVKCGVDEERVERDALALVPFLNDLNPREPFTEADARSALECFDERYVRFPRNDIAKLSGIAIKKNKRNFRKQSVHLGRARAVQYFDDPEGNWRNAHGAPTKEEQIKAYAAEHPEMSNRRIAEALGVSRNTVNKWLKG